MTLDFNNNVPIYVQLVEGLKIDIISGKLKPGEKLLSVRELALKMKVNPNTMQKALAELEDQKLIYTQRTNGKFVTEDTKIIKDLKKQYAKDIAKKYFASMMEIGFSKEETIEYITKLGDDK